MIRWSLLFLRMTRLKTLEDAADYNFGVQFARGADNMQTAVMDIEERTGCGHNRDDRM